MTTAWIFVGLVAAGVSGAVASQAVRAGASVFWTFLAGNLALGIWAWLSRDPARSLVAAAVLFDAVYVASWQATYWLAGEPFHWWHAVGVVLLTLGVLLTSLT